MSKSHNRFFKHNTTAEAAIKGNALYPDINGTVRFFQTANGVIVSARITGLPTGNDKCNDPIFAMHIHSGNSCTGNGSDPFANANGHYNPNGCPHPYHAGDLPPLFSANGNAAYDVLTNRFNVNEVIGLTVIVHSSPDDFTTQPSGNSGEKIACGVIYKI